VGVQCKVCSGETEHAEWCSDTTVLGQAIKDVACPQCRKDFVLRWSESWKNDEKVTLVIRGCPSGGVYDVRICCPHCDYEEPL